MVFSFYLVRMKDTSQAMYSMIMSAQDGMEELGVWLKLFHGKENVLHRSIEKTKKDRTFIKSSKSMSKKEGGAFCQCSYTKQGLEDSPILVV